VSFYGVKTGQTPTLLKKYERKTANHLFWSPAGQFIILAGMRNMNGVLEFIDTSDFSLMNNGEHFMCTDIEWDPTGRYVMSGVSWWGHKVDNAYWLWSFQGKILKRCQVEKFCQFLWRPRPPTLLSVKQIKDIKKNLKKYSTEFDLKDKFKSSTKSKEVLEKRKAKFDQFQAYRAKKIQEFQAQKAQRLELRGGYDTDTLESEPQEMEEEVVEFLVKEEETIID
jgi:translation initiation factor 3 subunit B